MLRCDVCTDFVEGDERYITHKSVLNKKNDNKFLDEMITLSLS